MKFGMTVHPKGGSVYFDLLDHYCAPKPEFCKREVVTYEFNPVQDSTTEWVISSIIAFFSTSMLFAGVLMKSSEICPGILTKCMALVTYTMWEMALRDAKQHEFGSTHCGDMEEHYSISLNHVNSFRALFFALVYGR